MNTRPYLVALITGLSMSMLLECSIMRTEQVPHLNQRATYQGRVAGFGSKPAYRGNPRPTMLLVDVRDAAGRVVTDHLWFTIGQRLAALQLAVGDQVQFDARVTTYAKSYKGRQQGGKPVALGYRLSYPTLRRTSCTMTG